MVVEEELVEEEEVVVEEEEVSSSPAANQHLPPFLTLSFLYYSTNCNPYFGLQPPFSP